MKLARVFLCLFIFSLPLGQLGKAPLGFQVNLYLSDFLALAALVFWLIYVLGVRKRVVLPPYFFLIFLFSLWAFTGLVNGGRYLSLFEWLVSSFYLWRFLLYTSLYFVAWDLTKNSPAEKRRILNLLVVSGLLLALAGFVQLAVWPDFGWMARQAGWDPHKNRLLSTFFDPNFTGAYLVLTISLVLAGLSDSGFKPFWLGSFSILLAALVLTFSRSAWLMFGMVVLVFGLFRTRWLIVLALAVAFLAYFLVPRVQTRIAGVTDPSDSAHFRFISWRRTWRIFKEKPLLGVGFNSFRYAQKRYGFFDPADPSGGHAGAGSDSSLLLILATTGVFGLIIFLGLYGAIAAAAFSRRRLPFSLALLAGLIGLLGESNFINSLFYPPIMAWFWLTVGILKDS